MHGLETSDLLPQCSRCGGDLIVSVVAPKNDTAGRPIHLQLCSACDGEKPAAGALLFWFASGGGHDMGRSEEGARLLMEWTGEAMAEYGWYWPGTDVDAATSVPGLEHDEAAARDLMNPGTAGEFPEIDQLQQERDARRTELANAGQSSARSFSYVSVSWAPPSPKHWPRRTSPQKSCGPPRPARRPAR
ncbi:DUF6300 family protein [Streptomyces avermitilis]|uniref:DUF6300 family protein n=1 Tax=Streptomyces avermitilis TaxID=33903 RepID=UPI003694A897